jgi:hypothetical protein
MPAGIRGCGVENPQGFGKMNADTFLLRILSKKLTQRAKRAQSSASGIFASFALFAVERLFRPGA